MGKILLILLKKILSCWKGNDLRQALMPLKIKYLPFSQTCRDSPCKMQAFYKSFCLHRTGGRGTGQQRLRVGIIRAFPEEESLGAVRNGEKQWSYQQNQTQIEQFIAFTINKLIDQPMQVQCLSPYTPMTTKTAVRKDFFIQSRKEDIKTIYKFHHKPIGRGGYGTVYQATLKQPPYTERCVKVINKKFIKNPDVLQNQVSILSLLDHPNINRLYETYQDKSYLYLVNDLCQGGQLFDRIDEFGCFPEDKARYIFIQMVKTVKYLHLQKICHRDLKAENFLFSRTDADEIMLIDFGLSYQWKNNMKQDLEDAGMNKIVGTSYYVSPEILKKDYDERCDVWALGVLLHVITTATAPFPGESDQEILQKIKSTGYTENPEIQALSPLLRDLISKILTPADKRLSLDEILKHPWVQKEQELKKVEPVLDYKKMRKFSTFSRLKAVVLAFIASQLPTKEIEPQSQLFKFVDSNNDGYLSVDEVEKILKKQGIKPSHQELHATLKSMDMDKNGKINFNEFVASMLPDDYCLRKDYLDYIFKYFDKDCNGKIGKQELHEQIAKMGLQLPMKAVDDIMKEADKDKDGEISEKQFFQAIGHN